LLLVVGVVKGVGVWSVVGLDELPDAPELARRYAEQEREQ
jgi:hypothetical protein